MSRVLTYQEPYRLPAGLLALTVHAAFFALLVFGMRWQSQPTQDFSVELWSSLPVVDVLPQQMPAPPVEPAPAVKAEPPPVKADIELREKNGKKLKDAEEAEKAAKKAEAIAKAAAAAAKQESERHELEAYAAQRAQTEQARIRAEVVAATATQVGRYQDMIRSKIRRNIVMPPDVPESAVAEFKVTLLPGGMVMDVVLLKSSGIPAYDDAAERAIHKAEPLPMPTETGLQRMFRELRLTIRP
jgi:colicin import membrane protein